MKWSFGFFLLVLLNPLRAVAYNLLADPDGIVSNRAGFQLVSSGSQRKKWAIVRMNNGTASLDISFREDDATYSRIDLRKTSVLRFRVYTGSSKPLTIQPTFNKRPSPQEGHEQTYTLPPMTSREDYFIPTAGEWRWNKMFFTLKSGKWSSYSFNVFPHISFEDPKYHRVDAVHLVFSGEGNGTIFVNDLEIVEPDMVCEEDKTLTRLLPEGAEDVPTDFFTIPPASGPTVQEVNAHLENYRILKCANPGRRDPTGKNRPAYRIFCKPPGQMDALFPGYIPKTGEMSCSNHFRLTATPGETRNLSFGIRAIGTPVTAQVSLENLRHGETGQLISPTHLKMSRIRYLYQPHQKERSTPSVPTKMTSYSPFPSLLEPLDKRETIPADFTRGIWLSLEIPANADPGIYQGRLRVTISRQGSNRSTLYPFEVEVLPFTLPPVDKPFAIMLNPYHSRDFPDHLRDRNCEWVEENGAWRPANCGELKENNLVRQWFDDIRGNGLNSALFFFGSRVADSRLPPGTCPDFDPEAFDKYSPLSADDLIDIYEAAGFENNLPFFYEPFHGGWNCYNAFAGDTFREQVTPVLDYLRDRGRGDSIIARQFDEPGNHWFLWKRCDEDPTCRSKRDQCLEACGQDPGCYREESLCQTVNYDQLAYSTAALRESFDVLRETGIETTGEADPDFLSDLEGGAGSPRMTFAGGYIPNWAPGQMVRARARGAKIFPIVQFAGGRTPLLADRGIKGFWAKYLDGYYGWTYCNPVNGPLNPFDGADAGAVACTNAKPIIPTLMWATNREAVNDYRYLLALEKGIRSQLASSCEEAANGWIGAANQLLADKGVFSDHPMDYYTSPPTDAAYEKKRQDLATLLLSKPAIEVFDKEMCDTFKTLVEMTPRWHLDFWSLLFDYPELWPLLTGNRPDELRKELKALFTDTFKN